MVTDLAFYKNIDHQICYLGGAFAHSFSPEGQEFEWTNFEMFKCPMGFQGGWGGGNVEASTWLTHKLNSFPSSHLATYNH